MLDHQELKEKEMSQPPTSANCEGLSHCQAHKILEDFAQSSDHQKLVSILNTEFRSSRVNAEDFIQQAYAELLENPGTRLSSSRIGDSIFYIVERRAKSRIHDHLRQKQVDLNSRQLMGNEPKEPCFESRIEARDIIQKARSSESMPSEDLEILTQRGQGETLQKISSQFGISTSTVRNRLSKSIKLLSAMMTVFLGFLAKMTEAFASVKYIAIGFVAFTSCVLLWSGFGWLMKLNYQSSNENTKVTTLHPVAKKKNSNTVPTKEKGANKSKDRVSITLSKPNKRPNNMKNMKNIAVSTFIAAHILFLNSPAQAKFNSRHMKHCSTSAYSACKQRHPRNEPAQMQCRVSAFKTCQRVCYNDAFYRLRLPACEARFRCHMGPGCPITKQQRFCRPFQRKCKRQNICSLPCVSFSYGSVSKGACKGAHSSHRISWINTCAHAVFVRVWRQSSVQMGHTWQSTIALVKSGQKGHVETCNVSGLYATYSRPSSCSYTLPKKP